MGRRKTTAAPVIPRNHSPPPTKSHPPSPPPPPPPPAARTVLFGTVLPPGSSSILFRPKSVALYDWWLSKIEGEPGGPKLGVCGINTMGKQVKRVFRSAHIVKRYDALTVETVDGVVIIIQDVINKEHMLENGFSLKVCKAFMTGFPYNWDNYAYEAFVTEASSEKTSSSNSNIADQYEISDCNLDSLCSPRLDGYSSAHIFDALKLFAKFFDGVSTGDVNKGPGISGDPISTETNQMPLNENISNDSRIVHEDCNKDGPEETINETIISGRRTRSMHKNLENKLKDKEEMLSSTTKVDRNNKFCKTLPNSANDLKLKCGWKQHRHGDGSGADEAFLKTADKNGPSNCSADKVTYSESPLKIIGPFLTTAAGNFSEDNQSEVLMKAQRSKQSSDYKKGKNKWGSSYSYVHRPYFTRKKATDLGIASPEAINLKRSRSGRVLVPALVDSFKQILYNADGSISAITGFDKLKSPSPGK